MVLACSLISSHLIKPMGIVPSAPVIIDITISFMFHNFFSSPANSFPLFSFSLIFTMIHQDGRVHFLADSFFVVVNYL